MKFPCRAIEEIFRMSPPLALPDHMAGRFSGAQEHAGEVHVQPPLPAGEGEFFKMVAPLLHEQAVYRNAGVVDQHIQPVPSLDEGLKKGLHLLLTGHIGPRRLDHEAFSVRLLLELLQAFSVHIAGQDPGTS
jgi:hypothetical protein